jgi:hypothetical protein
MVKSLLGVLVIVVLVGAGALVLWPTSTWSPAFCGPVTRVVGPDVRAILSYISEHNLNSYKSLSSTPTPGELQDRLVNDVGIAKFAAPTAQLRRELSSYERALGRAATLLETTAAFGKFDGEANTQLRACGITPIGR